MAHLIEFTSDPFEIKTIESKCSEEAQKENKNPNRQLLRKYYTKLAESIKNYNQVILFGPADAKIEFFDALSEDDRFVKIKIEIKDTDRMTRNQQHHFITEYFGKK